MIFDCDDKITRFKKLNQAKNGKQSLLADETYNMPFYLFLSSPYHLCRVRLSLTMTTQRYFCYKPVQANND